jgi:8-amino-7-oxononanoate synthase
VSASRREIRTSARPGRATVDGRERLVLCANDYLGLAADPRVIEGAIAATRRYGAGAGAARALSGDTALHRDLEARLAELKGTEAALTFSSGYLCNQGVLGALAGAADLICSDELNHASIVDGARLGPASSTVYAHADVAELDRKLAAVPEGGRALIVSDAVFSMDGDAAPVPEILDLAEAHGARVMLDDAHGTGVLGPAGEGTLAELSPGRHADVLTGTMGKALGSSGGFVAGDRALVEELEQRCRTFLFDTALAPAAAGAAVAALAVLRAEPERVARLRANARTLADGLRGLGYRVGHPAAAIVVVHLDGADRARELTLSLFEDDVIVHPIGPPYVASGTSRLRLLANATHDERDVERITDAFDASTPAGRMRPSAQQGGATAVQ